MIPALLVISALTLAGVAAAQGNPDAQQEDQPGNTVPEGGTDTETFPDSGLPTDPRPTDPSTPLPPPGSGEVEESPGETPDITPPQNTPAQPGQDIQADEATGPAILATLGLLAGIVLATAGSLVVIAYAAYKQKET